MKLGVVIKARDAGLWRFLASLAVVASLAVLPACDDSATRSGLDRRSAEATRSIEDMNHPAPMKHYNPLVVTDKVWAGDSALRMHRGLPLPARFETNHGITIVSSAPMSLTDIASDITMETGIPVRVSDVGGKAAASAGGDSKPTMPMSYEGSLSGLMERVAGTFGVNWRYDGSVISVARFESRVFVIEALPGTQSIAEGMQDDSGSSSSGGGSSGANTSQTSSITQNSKFSIDFKYWDELTQTINSMLGGTGTVVASPSLGTITVTTSPEVMRTIADYVSTENERLSRQIAISVEVYSITLTEGLDFNVAFSAVLNNLQNFGATVSSAQAPAALAAGVTASPTINVNILNGKITDLFSALKGIGDTTKVVKFPLVTLNNRPVSRRIGEDIGYVASATTSTAASASTSSQTVGTTLTPGVVHQGFSVQITPRLLDDGRILLEYSLSVIDVKAITTFNSICGVQSSSSSSGCNGGAGSSSIEVPDTINRIFVQQSVLKSGSMLLLGGAEEEDLQETSQGVLDPFNYLLGGGVASTKSHTMLIMAITPQVLDVPHSEND